MILIAGSRYRGKTLIEELEILNQQRKQISENLMNKNEFWKFGYIVLDIKISSKIVPGKIQTTEVMGLTVCDKRDGYDQIKLK